MGGIEKAARARCSPRDADGPGKPKKLIIGRVQCTEAGCVSSSALVVRKSIGGLGGALVCISAPRYGSKGELQAAQLPPLTSQRCTNGTARHARPHPTTYTSKSV